MRKSKRSTMKGGGLGNTFTFGAPIIPNLDAGQEVVRGTSCLATTPSGYITNPPAPAGLPGMGGGGRNKRARRKGSRRGQRGGRYSFDLEGSSNFGGTPYTSGIPQVVRIAPEYATTNPLNPVQAGGVQTEGGAAYFAPTAGYSNLASTWVGSTGAPSLLQTPYEARSFNPACLKTGGGRRSRSRRRKSRRKSRSRKSRSRKSRK